MIKVTASKRTVRETTAPFIHEEKGKETTTDIRVRYYSRTWNDMQHEHATLQSMAKDQPDAPTWPHESMAKRIESLPDLTDEHGKPFEITAKNLGDLDTRNLAAIRKAIDEDIAGKAQPAK